MPRSALVTRPDLDRLRARIRTLEGVGGGMPAVRTLHPGLDRLLPWGGLPRGCLHQVIAEDWGAATAFCAMIAGGLASDDSKPVLWCPLGDDLHAPGLAGFGLGPDRLILAIPANAAQAAWVMEEALRCPGLACVVAEMRGIDMVAGRRLQLAAEAGGVTGLLLHPGAGNATVNAGTTRWRLGARPGGRWRVILERVRGGLPAECEIAGFGR